MKLIWGKCRCGSSHCKLEYPLNIGQFYQGTGFKPDEKRLMDEAFSYVKKGDELREAPSV